MSDRPTTPTRSRLALIAVGALIVVAVSVTAWVMARQNQGQFVFPLDDAYIHIAVAKNLALHGTWGITPGHFESASSSPLWTVLLAACMLITRGRGVEITIIAISTVAAVSTCATVMNLVGWDRPLRATATALATAVVMIPLILSGMENCVHVALIIGALAPFARVIRGEPTSRDLPLLGTLLTLAMLCRFETVFVAIGMLIACVSIQPDGSAIDEARHRTVVELAWARRRIIGVTVCATVTPVILLASINRMFGQGLLPNSVLAKSENENAVSFLRGSPPIGVVLRNWSGAIIILLLVAFVLSRQMRERPTPTAVVFALILGPATLASSITTIWSDVTPYRFRYHAFLYVLAILVVGTVHVSGRQLHDARRAAVIALAVGCMIAFPALGQWRLLPAASWEIGRQQLQTARFLESEAHGAAVAVNDLGLVSVLYDGPIVDLVGLGSWKVLEQRRHGTFDASMVESITRDNGVELAIIYDSWFPDDIPDSWTPVRRWCLDRPNPATVGDPCVTFYPTSPDAAATWIPRITDFELQLPDGIEASTPS